MPKIIHTNQVSLHSHPLIPISLKTRRRKA